MTVVIDPQDMRIDLHDVVGTDVVHAHVHTNGRRQPDNTDFWASALLIVKSQRPQYSEEAPKAIKQTEVRFFFKTVSDIKLFTAQLEAMAEKIMEQVAAELAEEKRLNAEAKPREE